MDSVWNSGLGLAGWQRLGLGNGKGMLFTLSTSLVIYPCLRCLFIIICTNWLTVVWDKIKPEWHVLLSRSWQEGTKKCYCPRLIWRNMWIWVVCISDSALTFILGLTESGTVHGLSHLILTEIHWVDYMLGPILQMRKLELSNKLKVAYFQHLISLYFYVFCPHLPEKLWNKQTKKWFDLYLTLSWHFPVWNLRVRALLWLPDRPLLSQELDAYAAFFWYFST